LVPLGRYARLAEVAEAIALFGCPAFDPANGHTLTFDGGLSVQLRPVEVERPPPEESGTLGNLRPGHPRRPDVPAGGVGAGRSTEESI
jgi:hypothetical protein